MTNFKEGGRLATVRGNIVRNLRTRIAGAEREGNGFGIGVEADTTVIGNAVENARSIGISVPAGANICATSRCKAMSCAQSGIGVAVSVVKGAGAAVISGNVLARLSARAPSSAWNGVKPVTGDLALAGAERYPQLKISGNQVT